MNGSADVDPRVVQVFCEFPDGRRSKTGTGYLLDGGLVLTAAHVVGGDQVEGVAPLVQFVGARERYRCAVAWHRYEANRPKRGRIDAAVLRITDTDWRQPTALARVRWGRFVSDLTDIPVVLNTFPTAMDARDEQGKLVVRDLARISGVVDAGTSAKGRRYQVTINHPVPPSAHAEHSRWEGASGAALMCNGLVLGVAADAQSEPGWAWMSTVPVVELLADPEFSALVGPGVVEPAELQPVLEQPVVRQAYSPVSLLRPENAVVGFDRERDEIVDRLRDWCTSDGWFSIRLITGPGGQGKTRLADRLVAVMRERGWSCGFLHNRAAELDVVGQLVTPALLVIDYAETRVGQLLELLEVVDRRSRRSDADGRINGAPPVRVLLLARDSGDWWEEVRTDSLLLRDLGPGTVLRLPDLYPEARRQEALQQVVRDLARALHRLPDYAASGTGWSLDTLSLPDVTDGRFGRALDLHMTALVTLLRAAMPERPAALDEPDEAVLLRHEQRFWKRVAAHFGLGHLTLAERRRLVAAATLCVATDTDHAEHILARLTSLSAVAADVRTAITRWLAALYPSDRDVWSPLRPDRIGEYLVGLAVTDTPDLLFQLLPSATADESLGAVHVLARAASHQTHVSTPLRHVITAHPAALAPAAVSAATAVEHPEPLRAALAEVLDERDDDFPLLDRIYRAVPSHSQTLAGWAAELADRLTQLVGADVEAGRSGFADLAAAFNNLAFRLTAAGLVDLALPRNAMAVELYEQLSRHQPGVHEDGLATALEGYAQQLHLSGKRSDAAAVAERAVAVRRQRADTDEGRRLLADALTGYGHHLSATGDHEGAVHTTQQSVDLYRAAPESLRDEHRREFAAALMASAIAFSRVGMLDDAISAVRQSVSVYRGLVRTFPDAYRPDLAAALTNVAELLGDAGDEDAALASAEESVALYEELAATLPAAHMLNHAAALHCLAGRLAAAERWPESAQRAERAIAMFDHVAKDDGSDRTLELGTALDMYAIALSESDRADEAVAAGRRAIDVLRSAAGDAAVLAELGTALRNHAEVLREVDRAAEARPYSEEALELWRAMADRAPAATAGELHLAMLVHGSVLAALGSTEALPLLREGLAAARAAADDEMAGLFRVMIGEPGGDSHETGVVKMDEERGQLRGSQRGDPGSRATTSGFVRRSDCSSE
jgi:tetratricopeptide (TPR) repeat protein